MKTYRFFFQLLVVSLVLAATVQLSFAQDKISIEIKQEAGKDAIWTSPHKGKVVVNNTTIFEFKCVSPADCTHITVEASKGSFKASAILTGTQQTVSYQVKIGDIGPITEMKVMHKGTSVGDPIAVRPEAPRTVTGSPKQTKGQPATEDSSKLKVLLGTVCSRPTINLPYDRAQNRATVIVSPNGTVLSELPRNFDEDDVLDVLVLVDKRLFPFLRIKRKSQFQTPGQIRLVGEDIQVLTPQSLVTAECELLKTSVRNFQPGKGVVEIHYQNGDSSVPLGEFEFGVNPLYRGALSFGGAWSRVQDPGFRLQNTTEGKIVTASEIQNRRLVYAVFLTPFVWGKRDVEKSYEKWHHRINPTVGLVVDDPLNNALIGATAEFEGFQLSMGAHISHITVIDPKLDLAPGDLFDGEDIPTANDWKAGFYMAVSVDMRYAAKLMKSVISSVAN